MRPKTASTPGLARKRARVVGVAALSIGLAPAWAADGWIDNMPTAMSVVQGVRAVTVPVIQQRGVSIVGKEHLPERVAGTFIGLRQLMQMYIVKEGPPSPQGAKALRDLTNDYMQVELAIGVALRNSKAYQEQCEAPRTYLNRRGQKMFASTAECVRARLHSAVHGVFPSYDYRKALFRHLFCDSWIGVLEMMQQMMVITPSPVRQEDPSPADTLLMPNGVAAEGASICSKYGGDTNANGLCDDWENISTTAAGVYKSADVCAARITLLRIKTPDAQTIRVDFSRSQGSGMPKATFKLERVDRQTNQRTEIGVTVAPQPVTGVPETVILRTTGASLSPNTARPSWLQLTASVGGKDIGSIGCKQPIAMPSFKEFKAELEKGFGVPLFGPFDDLDQAAIAAEPVAREYATFAEHWSWYPPGHKYREVTSNLVRDQRNGKYYVTSFKLGKFEGTLYIKPGYIDSEDLLLSRTTTFDYSCERMEDFVFVGFFHTHPPTDNTFSKCDQLAAFSYRNDLSVDFKGSYLFRPDRCIDAIDGTKKESPVRQVKSCEQPGLQLHWDWLEADCVLSSK